LEIDWFSTLIGSIIGIIMTIFAYEYARWREGTKETNERKRQALDLLRFKLNQVITSWQTFKKTKEMHINPGLRRFRDELESKASSLRNIVSASEKLVSENVLKETIEITYKLTKLSQMKIYINGGRSWNAFLQLGGEIVKKCKELSQRLD